MKKIIILIFLIVALAQWAVPLQMIREKENTISEGKQFKFRTAPFDPYDYMRGKYIQLSFANRRYVLTKNDSYNENETSFVAIKEDKDGFAAIESVSKTKYSDNSNYVKAEINPFWSKKSDVTVNFPFERFYMEESKAPKAEKIYLDATSDTALKTFALVTILNGDAVVTDVIVGDKSIKQLMQNSEK